MRKYLLLALTVLLAATARAESNTTSTWSADYDYDEITEIDTLAPEWESTYTYKWYKYTPTEDIVMGVQMLSTSGSTGGLTIYYSTDDGQTIGTDYIKSSSVYMNSVTSYYYYLEADNVYYLRLYNYGIGYYLNLWDASSNFEEGSIGKGITEDDPVDLSDNGIYFVGNPYSSTYTYDDLYMAYNATEDGVLKIYSYKNISEATVTDSDGTETTVSFATDYTTSPATYVGKITVEAGKSYDIVINTMFMLYFYTALVQPTEGDADLPFELTLGENIVPAAEGTYYYTYNNGDQTGYASLTGTATGDNYLAVWEGSYGLGDLSYADATGTYGAKFELYYTDTDYTVIVYKTTATDEPDTLTFAVEDYAKGETSDNPIIIEETPYTDTIAAGTGSSAYCQYYQITIPEGYDIMEVNVTSELESDETSIYVNEDGTWDYESGTAIKMEVTAGSTYNIEFDSYETNDIIFTVTLSAAEQGDVITNPLIAVDGDNVVAKAGTLYYKYTATSSGKFELGVTGTDITAQFIDAASLNNYYYIYLDDTYNETDSTYFFEVAQDDSVIIIISSAQADDVFTIEIGEYGEGESKGTAINVNELENYTYTVSQANGLNPIWLKYTTQSEGGLTIDGSTMTRSNYNDIYYYKPTSTSAYSLYSHDTYSYYADFTVGADEDYYVYLLIDDDYWTDYVEGGTITFTERDYAVGESVGTAIELTVNTVDTVTLANTPSNNPVWYKVQLGAGDADFAFSSYPQYNIYQGEANALAGEAWATSVIGTSQSSYELSNGETGSYWRVYSTTIEEQDWYYIYQTFGYSTDMYINIQGAEPLVPEYDLTYVSVDPVGAVTDDELDALETIESLETVTLTYDQKVGVKSSATALAYDALGDTISATIAVADNDSSVVVTLTEAIASSGVWYVEVPAGTIGDTTYVQTGFGGGHVNDTIILGYVISLPFDEGTVTIEPEDGDTVNSLLDFTLTYSDLYAAYPTTLHTPYLTNEAGDTVTTATTKDKYSNYVTITLAEEITAEGTYTLVIPDSTYYLQDSTYTESRNKALSYTYVVVKPELTYDLEIASSDPDDSSEISELTTITLTFDEAVYLNPNGSDDTNYSTDVALYNYSTREQVTTATLSQETEGGTTVTVTLATTVSDEGTYRLYLPQGVIGDATAYKYDFTAGKLNARLSSAVLLTVSATTDGISTYRGEGEGSYRGISADANGNFTVYTLSGIRMMTTKSTSDIDNLPAGLYIINGTKTALK